MMIDNVKGSLAHYNFSEAQSRNILEIYFTLLQAGITLGEYNFCNSGGGCNHFYFKLKTGRWVWFHAESHDITISETFDTAAQVYDAFWEDSGVKVTSMALSSYDNMNGMGDFEPVWKIVKDIREQNFYNIQTN